MYNGIGLASVRGSGTNGYVQKNMAHVSRQRTAERKGVDRRQEPTKLRDPRRANTEIMEHNQRRAVEVKCLTLQESLEEKGTPDEEVERQVSELRASLLRALPSAGSASASAGGRAGETHADAARKETENVALKQALSIGDSYVAGSAFDRELQDRLKAERMAKREAEEEARREAEEELEREREREERRRRKEARREEKEAARAEAKKERKRQRDE